MADPLSISSALLAIITAAVQSSKALHQAVESFKNHQRAIQQLRNELLALSGVLESVQALADQDDAAFQPLRLPLFQCHQACTEFKVLIVACSKHSGGSRTSLRDWAKLRYMGGDVIEFTNMLSGYKSTIAIALADANLRSTTVTLQVLNDYKDMIQSTTQDLEDHLENINAKLKSLTARTAQPANVSMTISDQQRIQNEKDSTEQCLLICETVLKHIDVMRLLPIPSEHPGKSPYENPDGNCSQAGATATTVSLRELNRAHIITLSALAECSDKLHHTVSSLRAHNQDAEDRLKLAKASQSLELNGEEALKLKNERASVEQCLAICTKASEKSERIHTIEDVTMGDDGQQVFVSTLGDLFNLKNVSAGNGGIQFVGSVSDATLQHYFQLQQHK